MEEEEEVEEEVVEEGSRGERKVLHQYHYGVDWTEDGAPFG